MKRQPADAQEIPYPRIRRWTAAAYRSVRNKTMIHGQIEVDVTNARAHLQEYKATTGESLSFTAFLTACLAKAVDENKAVQAIRKGSKRLVIFNDVDVWAPIEHELAGQKVILPHIFRAANRKSFRAIHDEIRTAQAADIARFVKGPRFPPAALFRPYMWLFWRVARARPRFQKLSVGTVAITAIGMFGKGAGWGVPPPDPTPLLITVGGIGEKLVMADGRVTVREYLSLTISVDHDIVDGAPAARFTRRLKELIESGYGLEGLAVAPERVPADKASQRPVEAARR